MYYSIVTADMTPVSSRGQKDTCLVDVKKFVSDCSWSRLAANMNGMWAWDVRGLDGYESDGKCCFIEFN